MRTPPDQQNRIRREAKARLRKTISAIHAEARERGLSGEGAERPVTDDAAQPPPAFAPNVETIEAMNEARRGETESYRTVEDLMKSLHEDD